MTLSFDAGRRLDAALSIARRLRDAADPLGVEAREALLQSSGLSRAGLELALTAHLETEASASERARLLAWANVTDRCHVVLSANVVTGAFRAIVLGLVSAPHVLVKPSRRDPALAGLLVREIAPLLECGSLGLVESVAAREGDQLHAYGSDATISAIESSLPAGVRFRGHGSGFGVALIDESADIDRAALALARDVVAFDQRGCLSPRVVIALGSASRGRSLALALHRALSDLAQEIPRGDLDTSTHAELATFAHTMAAVGDVFEEHDHLVAFDHEPAELILPPAARAMGVLSCSDLSTVARMLAPLSRWITTLGIASAQQASAFDALRPRGARSAALGEMQRPPLDGPVDERGR